MLWTLWNGVFSCIKYSYPAFCCKEKLVAVREICKSHQLLSWMDKTWAHVMCQWGSRRHGDPHLSKPSTYISHHYHAHLCCSLYTCAVNYLFFIFIYSIKNCWLMKKLYIMICAGNLIEIDPHVLSSPGLLTSVFFVFHEQGQICPPWLCRENWLQAARSLVHIQLFQYTRVLNEEWNVEIKSK